MRKHFIAPIVEGHGEVQALPVLLRRIFDDCKVEGILEINPPIRVKAGSFLNDKAYFRKHLELAARKAKSRGGSVLILLDSEDECPAQLGPRLADWAKDMRGDVVVTVALARREYESWFLAAASSLRGCRGLPPNAEPPSEPELQRDAKGWLSSRMGRSYNEPNDQPSFTAQFSLDEASAVASFRRLRGKLSSLFLDSA